MSQSDAHGQTRVEPADDPQSLLFIEVAVRQLAYGNVLAARQSTMACDFTIPPVAGISLSYSGIRTTSYVVLFFPS